MRFQIAIRECRRYFATAAEQRAEEVGLDTTMPMEGDAEAAAEAESKSS
jgi:hypothetical protein